MNTNPLTITIALNIDGGPDEQTTVIFYPSANMARAAFKSAIDAARPTQIARRHLKKNARTPRPANQPQKETPA